MNQPLSEQPTVRTADGRREFACFPAAILGFLINERDEVLLLSHPSRKGSWEVINGAIEAGESPLQALYRETREEAGPLTRINPVAVFHTFLYRFDAQVRSLFSIAYAATYLGGEVTPGHDMAMSDHRWASLSEIEGGTMNLLVPSQTWLFRRAVVVHSLLKETNVELEPWQPFEPLRDAKADRILTAVMFTDLVASTDTAVKMGDAAWVEMLQGHDRIAHSVTSRLGGRIVKSTGDGVLALFASVEDAVTAGKVLQLEAQGMGLAVRAGVHVGEVTLVSIDVAGQAVVVASRLCALASPGELLVSRTAADLLAGSRIELGSPRKVEMRGLGETDVFAASIPVRSPDSLND